MDDIQSKSKKARKSLEEQFEEIRQKELVITAKREMLESKINEQKRKARTRAFVCMGSLIDKMMKNDEAFKQQILIFSKKVNIFNREGMGKYWPEFMPSESEFVAEKSKQKEKTTQRVAKKRVKIEE